MKKKISTKLKPLPKEQMKQIEGGFRSVRADHDAALNLTTWDDIILRHPNQVSSQGRPVRGFKDNSK